MLLKVFTSLFLLFTTARFAVKSVNKKEDKLVNGFISIASIVSLIYTVNSAFIG